MKSYYSSVEKKLLEIKSSLGFSTSYYSDLVGKDDSQEYKQIYIKMDAYYKVHSFDISVDMLEVLLPLTATSWETSFKVFVIRERKNSQFILRLDGHVAIPDYLKGKEAGNYHFDLEIKDQGKWEITNPPMPPATANSLDFLNFVATILNSNDDIFDPNRWDLELKKTFKRG